MVRSRNYIATPPGATIREQLNDRGISQKEFAIRMHLSEKHVSKLINGDVQLTPAMAIRLEIVLGISAGFWNRLEAIYREKLLKAEAENMMEEDESLAKQLPYNEMARFGWVPEAKKSKEKVEHLRKYFELVQLSLLENKQISQIACRRLAVTEKSDLALLAWVQEAKLEARKTEVSEIDIKRLKENTGEIRMLTVESQQIFMPELKKILANCGIALVFIPHLKGSFLQGASFKDGKKIVIGMTARGRYADIFWFSLFHEIAHIVLGHIGYENGTTDNDEKDADNWARNILIPDDEFNEFKYKKDYSSDNVCKFAADQGISPGIVVGRLQKEGCIKHSELNELKEHYDIDMK